MRIRVIFGEIVQMAVMYDFVFMVKVRLKGAASVAPFLSGIGTNNKITIK